MDGEAEVMYGVLEKHSNWKAIGITAWLARFLFNLRSHPLERRRGVLRLQDTLFGFLRKIATARSKSVRFSSNVHQMLASACKIW